MLWANWAKFVFMTIIFVILYVTRHVPRLIPRHLLSSHLIYYDKCSDKYHSHNLVTNVQFSLRLMTIGSVSHRRGLRPTFYDNDDKKTAVIVTIS